MPGVKQAPPRGYLEQQWGDGTAPPLYCPARQRDDEVLAGALDQRLVAWLQQAGFADSTVTAVRRMSLGRFVASSYASGDDLDRLLLCAQLNAAWWMADDYYTDDSSLGAQPEHLSERLSRAMAAMSPLAPVADYTRQLEAQWTSDPVLMALRSATDHLRQRASPTQVGRVCHTAFGMFMSWTVYGEWKRRGVCPSTREYLATRQFDSFYTSLILIDIAGGYELPPNVFYDPRVRQALFQAGLAAVIVNDLYSARKEAADGVPMGNLVLVMAAEHRCSHSEAVAMAVALHNNLTRDFEVACRGLANEPSVELQRYLQEVRAWMGGSLAWHDWCPRYHQP
ncbi:terpene synthase family protein [Pseudomonas sp. RHF3.3-3]|uniref:Terpene synthase n=1 Tax=Pseudomonas asplenii TaxID=53407 RepID=A0A0N0E2J6_9PSED|nr:terpene synthase [Pseudomonas fuscovaginae]KPA88989.1 terpene synthase family protein [Pseudomonas fuscovaginae]